MAATFVLLYTIQNVPSYVYFGLLLSFLSLLLFHFNMSRSKDNSHKLPSNLNLHAYSFFDQHTLENWTLENYYHFYKRKINPNSNYNTIIRYYSQDIEIIRTNKNVDEGVRRATTALKSSVVWSYSP